MRMSSSLGDLSNIASVFQPTTLGTLSSLPDPSSVTRLAIFCSSAVTFSPLLSAVKKQNIILETENSTLRDSVKSLSGKNTILVSEIEALRVQTRDLIVKNSELVRRKEKLVDELQAERIQGSLCVRKAYQDRLKIRELESSAKQRDAFIHAMIDIDLHRNVLKDGYFAVEAGRTADEAIVAAIQSAANKPASPWSKIIEQPDVTKSDLYKHVIELAAISRLQAERSVKVARFWKRVAKYDSRNTDIITPSLSTLEDMDQELGKEERGNMLDDLLDGLRAYEDMHTLKKEHWTPMITRPDNLEDIPKSPTSVFFEFYQKNYRGMSNSAASLATLSSQTSDFVTISASNKTQGYVADDTTGPPPDDVTLNSLKRICEIFSISSLASSLDYSSSSVDPFSSPRQILRPVTSFTLGRSRSATVPVAARDLVLLPVKNVVSKVPVVTPPGGEEKQAQALAGRKVRINNRRALARSKAITSKSLSMKKVMVLGVPAPTETPITNSKSVILSVQNKTGLLTPPAEVESIRYVRPPTVTRKKGYDPPYFGNPPTIPIPSTLPNRRGLDSVPSSPSEQKTRRYAVRDSIPGPCKLESFTPSHLWPSSSGIVGSCSSKMLQQVPVLKARKQLKHPPRSASISESNKENVPPRLQSSFPVIPVQPFFSSSKIPVRAPPTNNSHRNSLRASPRSPQQLVKPIASNLKPVQPLRIVKKSPTKRPRVS